MSELIKLSDIDNIVNKFLLEQQQGIATLHSLYFKSNNLLSYKSLVEELFEELKSGTITFYNKHNNFSDINPYLFYIVNSFCKNKTKSLVKKGSEYLCPGCLFLGKENLISFDGIFSCDNCLIEFNKSTDPKMSLFFGTFKKHNKKGWKCSECNKFIPHPLNNDSKITCPYLDCCFVGDVSDLSKLRHPTSESKVEYLTLDDNASFNKNSLVSSEDSPYQKIENEEDLQLKLKIIIGVIDNQINTTYWNKDNITTKHKIFVYQAFRNLINNYPTEMIDYLLNNSRSGGFQHKIFQEYVSILEKNLPFLIKKNKTLIKVESLLDKNLNLFDGISTFDGIIDHKFQIKNETKDFYIGNRKASYANKFYIGKLLNVIIKETGLPVLSDVDSYSFSKIKLKNSNPALKAGTFVVVTHLRVPPHYQMGGMVYVNRIRKNIIDKSLLLLEKKYNEKV